MSEHLLLQVGDEVALVMGSGDYKSRRIRSVFSSGEAAFELDDGTRYTAEGVEVGGCGALGRMLPMTDAVRAHIQRRESLTCIRNTDWRNLTNSQLARIVAIIREHEEKEVP